MDAGRRGQRHQLGRVARLLRDLHEAGGGFDAPPGGPETRPMGLPLPGSVWNHGDAHYGNIVYQDGDPVALIDWDFVAEGDGCYDPLSLLVCARQPRLNARTSRHDGRPPRTSRWRRCSTATAPRWYSARRRPPGWRPSSTGRPTISRISPPPATVAARRAGRPASLRTGVPWPHGGGPSRRDAAPAPAHQGGQTTPMVARSRQIVPRVTRHVPATSRARPNSGTAGEVPARGDDRLRLAECGRDRRSH